MTIVGSATEMTNVMTSVASTVRLGTAANLIDGFDPSWVPGDRSRQGLFPTPGTPLAEQDIVITPGPSAWELPTITVHDDAAALLGALLPYSIANPSDGVKEADIALGKLLVGDQDAASAIAQLSATLGIPLDAGYGYALVKIRRISGKAAHGVLADGMFHHPNALTPDPALGVNEDFRKSLVQVRPALGDTKHFDPGRLTAGQAQECLDVFSHWGTHFVSSISVGDLIFQVFCYRSARSSTVKREFASNDFSGYNAVNFASLTTDANTGTHGFVAALGTITCLSGDPAIQQSIADGKWHDAQWTGSDSILAPLLNGESGFSMASLQAFTASVPVDVSLTTLTMFAEIERRRCLRRVFKGAVIQKFGTAVKPHFETYSPYDVANVIPGNDVPGFVSNIATPNINIYSPRVDLGDLQFVAAETTDAFVLCANLLCATAGGTTLPGTRVAILCQDACFESDDDLTIVTVSDAAFGQYEISAGTWYGCIQVGNTAGSAHETILDGLLYRYGGAPGAHGRFSVEIAADLRQRPEAATLPLFKDSLQFAHAFAASILGTMGNLPQTDASQTRRFVTDTLGWLSAVIPGNSDDIDLVDLRVRALDGYRMARQPAYGAYVPLLPAVDYQSQVDAILGYVDAINQQIREYQQRIAERKTQELLLAADATLDANIEQSAQLLVGSIQASAAQQQDLNGYYATLVAKKSAELDQLNETVTQLGSSLDDQKINVGIAVKEYKQAVKDWETRKAISFALGLATAMFEIAGSVAMPVGEVKAVAALGEAAQAFQKLLNIINNVFKAYTAADAQMNGLLNAQSALDDVGSVGFDITSNQQWDEMNANMSFILNLGPGDDPEMLNAKLELLKDFNILLTRGKAWISAKSAASQLAADLYNQQKQQLLSQRQQARLDALSASLKPENLPSLDPSTLDLAGLTSSLVYTRSQLLSMLASTFVLQDQALQYQNLQDASPITSFDLLSFKSSVLRQATNRIAAQNRLNAIQKSVTNPIRLQLQTAAAQLTQGRVYVFPVLLDNALFSEYVDARIVSVDLALSGVTKTDSGKYTVMLEYDGSPFTDRDPQRRPLTFRTPTRQRTYEYQAGSNLPNYTDGGQSWSQDVTPITPFSNWRISIPATEHNQGIVFSDPDVTITLSFVLDARVVDQAPATRAVRMLSVAAAEAQPASGASPGLGLTNAPSMPALVASMQGRSVVNGWDAVFNFSLDRIQKVINKQFDELKNNTKFGGAINVQTSTRETQHITILKKFDLVYGYPKLSFSADDVNRAEIAINIISGSITSGSQVDDGPIQWDPAIAVDAAASITASLPLKQEAGIVTGEQGNNTLSVVLSLDAATFAANNMQVMNDDDKAAFNTTLIRYFLANPVHFIINTLDLHPYATLPDLQPSQFFFRTLITPHNRNQILQLFISTNHRTSVGPAQAFLVDVEEPIPMAADFSLLISSRIFFNSVLPASLNQSGWQIRGVDPGNPTAAWSSQYTQGMVSIPVDLSALNRTDSYQGQWGDSSATAYTFSVISNPVTIAVSGTALVPAGAHVNVKMDSPSLVTAVNEHTDHWDSDHRIPYPMDNRLNASYTIHLAADIPIAVTGAGSEQTLSFHLENTDVHPSGTFSDDGSWGCKVDVSDLFTSTLRSQMPGPFASQLNVRFKDISVFALKNLLFTDGSMITIADANIPGDLLLTGTISTV